MGAAGAALRLSGASSARVVSSNPIQSGSCGISTRSLANWLKSISSPPTEMPTTAKAATMAPDTSTPISLVAHSWTVSQRGQVVTWTNEPRKVCC